MNKAEWQALPVLPEGSKMNLMPKSGKALKFANLMRGKNGGSVAQHKKIYPYASGSGGICQWAQRLALGVGGVALVKLGPDGSLSHPKTRVAIIVG